MISIINMQEMRYLNLFSRITGVNTRHCLRYNEGLIFCVPNNMMTKALGREGSNVRKLSEIIHKRVRIIPIPRGTSDAKLFIEKIVSPVTFKDLEITDDEIILTAGSQSKAALIGRNKRRLIEMQRIVKDFFKKEFRIV